ncbi:unnamed protein product [Echinostoma caproni]|uniref:MADF domain-containing protein n=1 Tax=Echinostoma caproni TaxID=27848 RepID=A0A183B1P0_9TREM|nr:unnamed protein product [Echinostoma caproni]
MNVLFVAIIFPSTHFVSLEQVKKKWENLVSKTKQKLRSGRVTADTDWSDTNTAVLEFLAHHNPFLRMRYATAAASILSSAGTAGSGGRTSGKRSSGTATITTDFAGLTRMYDSQMQSLGLPGLSGSLGIDPHNNEQQQQQQHHQQQQQQQHLLTLIKEEVKSVSSTEMNPEDESGDALSASGIKSTAGNRESNNLDNR